MTVEDGQQSAVGKGSWGRAAEFFVTMLGFAVGLGNVWRFPNVVYKSGGGAFFIPYVLAIAVIGVPLFLLEAAIGQYSRKNSVEVWDISPVFRGVGIASAFVISTINIYYTTPQAWSLFYFATSMAPELPWAACNPDWATANCTNLTSAQEYFFERAINISEGLTDWGIFNWELFLCNMAVWIIIFAAVCYGASSLGKVAYFTSLFPYVMLTAMLIFTLTLPGSNLGVDYYLLPNMERLTDIRVWSSAVSQVFFSTGLGCGVVAQLSSYNKFNHPVLRDAVLVPLSDALTSLYAGFSVFAVLGYMSVQKQVSVPDVVTAGPGLIFITYPEAFTKMPGGQVWAVFFFLMTCILGLSSSIPSVECVSAVIGDYAPWFTKTRLRNISLRFGLCALQFALGTFFYFQNGFYSYSLIDDRVIGYGLMIIGMIETAAITWFYGPMRLLSNIEEMIGGWHRFRFLRYYFVICWVFLCPAGILFIFIFDVATFSEMTVEGYTFPDWALGIGWGLVGIYPLIIIIVAAVTLCGRYRCYKPFWRATQPNRKWRKREDAPEPPRFEAPPAYEIQSTLPTAPNYMPPPPMWPTVPPQTYSSSYDEIEKAGLSNPTFVPESPPRV